MSDYREVLQNPRVAFKNPELQTANVKQTPLGLPVLVSGGFALTTCVTTKTNGHNTKWAIRCFHKEVPDLQERYQYISNFLQKQTDKFFVNFHYEPEGIQVRGSWYPIVKMAWVEGDALNEYIEDNLNKPTSLSNLAEQVKLISKRLHELKMSHGDLQHGNMLVHSGNPILIDYDGMYVPGMPYKYSNEIGHINFQHPGRRGSFFNERVDRFSTIVLYVTLIILDSYPSLWNKYHTGENLLFSRIDYQDTNSSALFLDLEKIPKLAPLVNRFKQLCLCSIEDIPPLHEFLNNSIFLPPLQAAFRPSIEKDTLNSSNFIQRQFKVLASTNLQEIVKQEGERITIVGQVISAKYYAEGGMFFINFGNRWDSLGHYKPFTVVIFAQGIEKIYKVKKWDISALEGLKEKYVEITGLLGLYPKNGYLTPQIILEDPYHLKIITGAEARQLLAPPPPQASDPTPPRRTQPTSSTSNRIPPRPKPPTTISGSQTTSSSGSPSVPPRPLPPRPVPPPQPQVVQPISSTTRGSTPPSQTTYPVASSSRSSSQTSSNSSSQTSSNSSSHSSKSSTTSSNDCFIATATFGTPYAPEVNRYRRFRDEYLRKTFLGTEFIRAYYYVAPALAKVIRNNPKLKKIMVILLTKLSKLLPLK
ncbi:hypothetical protein Oscil6304_3816 [Oscillatoria acuminata PCC 6304]|uniref:Protein kinase domain-containing protein n=2 Tax=Oscillatoria acuminata TaxID=118323 RepID=K9TML2_9CYAN|nr:hypothetical protein Oscil6304_3816 [Oscillatoria acuminata PCC 6304]